MATATKKAPEGKTLPRLKAQYRTEIVPALTSEFNFANPMGVRLSWSGSFAAGQSFESVLPELVAEPK